jgi:hypothetical protein
MLKNCFDFYEKFSTVSADNFFSLKKIYELRKYDLCNIDIKVLRLGNTEDTMENFNNQVCVENFLIKLSRDFFRTVKAVYPN